MWNELGGEEWTITTHFKPKNMSSKGFRSSDEANKEDLKPRKWINKLHSKGTHRKNGVQKNMHALKSADE